MTEPPLALQDFLAAARQGALVWVEEAADGTLAVGAGTRLAPAAGRRAVPPRAHFVAALESRFGDDTTATALRELGSALDGRSLTMAADVVDRVVGCAEGMTTLSDARGQVLRMEYSATLLGRRFVAICGELGVVAAEMPLSHRQAIDEAMRRSTGGETPVASLRRLLARPPLH